MVKLYGVVQQYAWGKIGSDSLAAQLYSLNCNQEIKEEPYAEVNLFN